MNIFNHFKQSRRDDKRVRTFCVVVAGTIFSLATTVCAQPASQYYVHPAVVGDTLVHLAKRYLVKPNDWQSLQRLNKITNPYRIRPGTEIRIPLIDMKTDQEMGKVIASEGPAESGGDFRGKAPDKPRQMAIYALCFFLSATSRLTSDHLRSTMHCEQET